MGNLMRSSNGTFSRAVSVHQIRDERVFQAEWQVLHGVWISSEGIEWDLIWDSVDFCIELDLQHTAKNLSMIDYNAHARDCLSIQ